GGGSGSLREGTNVPLARYSRDETAVVNGATGTCDSSFAPRAKIQPSGVLRVAGSAEGTCPSSGGDAAAAAGSASESATVGGAMVTDMTKQTARTATRRTTTAICLTRDTVYRVMFELRNWLLASPKLLRVRN